MPAMHRTFLFAPEKSCEARRRFLGPGRALAGIGGCGEAFITPTHRCSAPDWRSKPRDELAGCEAKEGSSKEGAATRPAVDLRNSRRVDMGEPPSGQPGWKTIRQFRADSSVG